MSSDVFCAAKVSWNIRLPNADSLCASTAAAGPILTAGSFEGSTERHSASCLTGRAEQAVTRSRSAGNARHDNDGLLPAVVTRRSADTVATLSVTRLSATQQRSVDIQQPELRR